MTGQVVSWIIAARKAKRRRQREQAQTDTVGKDRKKRKALARSKRGANQAKKHRTHRAPAR